MSEDQVTMTKMTDIELSNLLGVTNVHINRIRHGNRLPSFPLMMQIQRVLGWSIDDQSKHREFDGYAKGFEEAAARYASARNTDVGSGETPPTPHTE